MKIIKTLIIIIVTAVLLGVLLFFAFKTQNKKKEDAHAASSFCEQIPKGDTGGSLITVFEQLKYEVFSVTDYHSLPAPRLTG